MISIEILRRYPFFAGLSHDQLLKLATAANEETISGGEYIFQEGDILKNFFLLLQGSVGLMVKVPDNNHHHKASDHITNNFVTRDILFSNIIPGEVFGWSGLIPPHECTASAKALANCQIVRFDREALSDEFNLDPEFGFWMTQKMAQIIRQRLQDLRTESLAYHITEAA